MKHRWPDLDPDFLCGRPRTTAVLIESDVPELVLAESNGASWLGVFSEHHAESGRSRWVYAPLSGLEQRALLRGVVAPYACFRKPRVLVIDEEADERTRVYHADGLLIERAALPAPDFLLPEWARPAPEPSSDATVMTLAQRSVQRGVSLMAMSAIAEQYQRVHLAIGLAKAGKMAATGAVPHEIVERFTVNFVAASPGSLKIELAPRSTADFERSNAALESLMGAPAERLPALLGELGPRVRASYEKLLRALVDHESELMVERPGGRSVFVSPWLATEAIGAIPVATASYSEEQVATGQLIGFDVRTRTFSLYDEQLNKTIQGTFSSRFEPPTAVTVGFESPRVLIRFVRVTQRQQIGTRSELLLRGVALLEAAKDAADGLEQEGDSASRAEPPALLESPASPVRKE